MRILSIDWDLPQLCIVCAKVTQHRVEIEHVERLVWSEENETDSDANRLAQWFLESVSFNPGDYDALCVVIARDRVAVRKFEVPSVPDGELPYIVKMQLASQVTTRMDELVVDFIAIPSTNSEGMQEVIASTIPQKTIPLLQEFAKAIGCPLQSVSLSSLALAEILCDRSQDLPDQTTIGVAAGPSRIETLLVHGSQYISGSVRHRFSELPVDEKELTAEIKRILLSNESKLPQQNSPRIVKSFAKISDIKSGAMPVSFEKLNWDSVSLNIETDNLNEEQRGWLEEVDGLAAIGAAVSEQDKSHPQINFASPRQASKPMDRKKVYSIAGAISLIVLIVLIGAGVWLWRSQLSSLEQELNAASKRLATTEKFIRDQKSTSEESQQMQEYLEHRLALSKHFSDIIAAMPDRKVMVFTKYQSVPLNGETHTRINGSGLAVSRQEVQTFAAKLAVLGYLVRPGNIQAIEGQSPYQVEFELEFEIPVEESGES